MAPESGSENEARTGPPEYDQEGVNKKIANSAAAFEKELNQQVTPWIELCSRLFWSRLIFGPLALLILVPLSVVAFFVYLDRSLPWALGIAASPLLFALWTLIREDRTENGGRGMKGIEGLNSSCSELKGVLKLAHRELVGEKNANIQKLPHRTGHGAVNGVTDLCALRMKCLLFDQKVQGTAGLLTKTTDDMLKTARTLLFVIPGALALLVFAFAFPFLFLGAALPWKMSDIAIAGQLIVAVLITSFVPLFLVCRFVGTIKRKLSNALDEHWQIEHTDFDSTGPITAEFQKMLNDLDKALKEARQRRLHAQPSAAQKDTIGFPGPQ